MAELLEDERSLMVY